MAAQKLRRKHSSPGPDVIFTALVGLTCAALVFLMPYLAAGRDKGTTSDSQKNRSAQTSSLKGLPPTDLTEDEAIVHVLNRLGYGPRPGDVQRIKDLGLAKWIDRQLHPESMSDAALDSRLARFPTLRMSSEALLEKFPRPQAAAQREGMSPQEYRKEQQEKLQAARQAADTRQDQIGQANADSQQGENAQQSGNNVSPQSASPQSMAPR